MEPISLLSASSMLTFEGIALAAYSIFLSARKERNDDPLIGSLSLPTLVLAVINLIAVLLLLSFVILEYPLLKILSFILIFASCFTLTLVLLALLLSVYKEEKIYKKEKIKAEKFLKATKTAVNIIQK